VNGAPRGGDPAGPAAVRLRQLRARHGLSQEQLARLLGVSFATVNRWETGRTQMSARTRQALADFETRDGQAEGGQARDRQPGDGQAGDGQARGGTRALRLPARGAGHLAGRRVSPLLTRWQTRRVTSEARPAAAAGTWKLGDLVVNRLGFGAMRLTGGAAFDLGTPSDRDQSIRVLRRAVELGVNHIDTAAFYFSPLRSANELINTALAPYPDDLVIATKVGPGRDPTGKWLDWARPDQLRGQVEENLRQLGRDHLDLVNLRAYPVDSIAEHFGVLAGLRDAGLIRHLGVSGVRPPHLAQAQARRARAHDRAGHPRQRHRPPVASAGGHEPAPSRPA
jgi:transcriptional regulator with XRE-family HTH domain